LGCRSSNSFVVRSNYVLPDQNLQISDWRALERDCKVYNVDRSIPTYAFTGAVEQMKEVRETNDLLLAEPWNVLEYPLIHLRVIGMHKDHPVDMLLNDDSPQITLRR